MLGVDHGRMSVKRESPDLANIAVFEQDYWQKVQAARTLEDAKMDADYRNRRDTSRARLIELYNRKSQIQNELQSLEAGIAYQEQEQERLNHDFDRARSQLQTHREEEDRQHHEWLTRAREDAKRDDAHSKTNGQASSNGEPQSHATATGGWTSINGSRRRSRREEEELPADPGNLLGSVYHNPVDEHEMPRHSGIRNGTGRAHLSTLLNGASAGEEENASGQDRKSGERPLKPKERHSLPTFTSVVRSPVGKPGKFESKYPGSAGVNERPAGLQAGMLLMDPKQKSTSGRKSLPDARRSATPAKKEEQVNDGKEITAQSLVFKDDGRFITYPPIYEGIPLEKIHPKHEYWDPEWEPLESLIEPQVNKWLEKLDVLKKDPGAVRHSIFLANRQVNRGQQILDFLKNESVTWHPYQFVGKGLMAKFYKTLINYDTMYRLVNIHNELKKFELDVTPLEWLRQRTYEVAEAQGDKFNFSKYTHDMYHDAKVKALREKHGFGNIGRPSGYKLGDREGSRPPKNKAKKEPTGASVARKKGRRSIGQVDPDEVLSVHDQQQGYHYSPREVLEPVTPRLQKRQRLETTSEPPAAPPCLPPLPPPVPEVDDLDFEGYTTHDSFSDGRIMHLDWRVNQVKTRMKTTSLEVTQYWTWKGAQNMFEHQVLRDIYPKVTWGFYETPVDFNLQLQDLERIEYARGSQKIVVVIKDQARGNILAHFKRERTKRRFLAFAQKKGVKLAKKTA